MELHERIYTQSIKPKVGELVKAARDNGKKFAKFQMGKTPTPHHVEELKCFVVRDFGQQLEFQSVDTDAEGRVTLVFKLR